MRLILEMGKTQINVSDAQIFAIFFLCVDLPVTHCVAGVTRIRIFFGKNSRPKCILRTSTNLSKIEKNDVYLHCA